MAIGNKNARNTVRVRSTRARLPRNAEFVSHFPDDELDPFSMENRGDYEKAELLRNLARSGALVVGA